MFGEVDNFSFQFTDLCIDGSYTDCLHSEDCTLGGSFISGPDLDDKILGLKSELNAIME